MSLLYLVCAGISFLVFLTLIIVKALAEYQLERDIYSWKNRTLASANPIDILEYMTKVKTGLGTKGMTQGNAAIFFPTAKTDMACIYRTVCGIVDQAEVISRMDHSNPGYQAGMDNLREAVAALDIHAKDYWNNHGIGLVISIFSTLTLICVPIFFFAAIIQLFTAYLP